MDINLTIDRTAPSPIFFPTEPEPDTLPTLDEITPPAPEFMEQQKNASDWSKDAIVLYHQGFYYPVIPGTRWTAGTWRWKLNTMRSPDRVAAQVMAAQVYCAINHRKHAPRVRVQEWPLQYNFQQVADRPRYVSAMKGRKIRQRKAQEAQAGKVPNFLQSLFNRDLVVHPQPIAQMLSTLPTPVSTTENPAWQKGDERKPVVSVDELRDLAGDKSLTPTIDDYCEEHVAHRAGRHKSHLISDEDLATIRLSQSLTLYYMAGTYRPSQAETVETNAPASAYQDRRVILWTETKKGPIAIGSYLSLAEAQSTFEEWVWFAPRYNREMAQMDWRGEIPMRWDPAVIKKAQQDLLWVKIKAELAQRKNTAAVSA